MFNWIIHYFRKEKICPNCHLENKYDGYKCFHCGYIHALVQKKPELLSHIMDLFDPKPFNPKDIYYNKQLIPELPGVYAWYFDSHIENYFANHNENMIKIHFDSDPAKYWYLLYIGIAGKNKERTLRDRIYQEHLNQNSKGSTLRQSLAALLWQDIDLDPAKQLNGENEKWKLNNWIFQHAKVTWTKTTEPEIVEDTMLHEYGKYLLLNIKGNRKNACLKYIKRLRKKWTKGM